MRSFWASSWDSPSSSGPAGKTVVVDGVNVFLDLEAEVLRIVHKREGERDQPARSPFRVARSVFPRRAKVAYLYAP